MRHFSMTLSNVEGYSSNAGRLICDLS